MLLAYGFFFAYGISLTAFLVVLISVGTRLVPRSAAAYLRPVGRGLLVLFTVYVFILVGGFAYQLIISNVAASTEAERDRSLSEISATDELLARLPSSGVLVLVSISGGGSRAAYFAGAVLERLQSFHIGDASAIDSSLVYNIGLVSTVSGGSLAGAYFAARLPDPVRTDAAGLESFFREFKDAMADNFEAHILSQLADPRYTLDYLIRRRSVATGLADVFDSTMLGNHRLTFAELNKDAAKQRRPLFVPNATNLNRLALVPFAGRGLSIMYGDIVPSGRPDPRDNAIIPWAADLPDASVGFQTFSLHRQLDDFPVAKAVAASAAFPGLGLIDVFTPNILPHSTLHLADGGMIDNSGLLSLYALTFKRELFERGAGSLRRIVLISIDATAHSGLNEDNPGFVDEITGMYTLQQRYAELFVAPSWLHRLFGEELSGLFSQQAQPPVSIPPRIVFSYSLCGHADPTVSTSFHLALAERNALDRAAQTCVDMNRNRLQAALNEPYIPYPRYEGILKAEDYRAASALLGLAYEERLFENTYHRWALEEQFRQPSSVLWQPLRGAEGSALVASPLTIKLASELTSEKTGFVFDAKADGDALILRATPEHYGTSGFVSLLMKVTREMTHIKDEYRFCIETNNAMQGGDYSGSPAPDIAPPFHPPRRKPLEYPCI